ncbi:MAG: hypothetical protein QNJ07_00345 [Woeseiaceae bacterium]|nr:hypothetical protein [Woeseiaceae bacterium]
MRCIECSPAVTALILLAAGTTATAAPGDVLFSDGFEGGAIAPWTTTNAARSGVSNNAGWAGTGTWGAYTRNSAVSVTSPTFNAAVPDARLDIWIRRGADSFSEDTDNNENLVLEYRRADSSWVALKTYLGSGTNGQVYQDSFLLPADALHGALAVRLRQTQGSGVDWDYWHFDDVVVTEIAPAPPLVVGTCDDFENGLNANWTVVPTTGFAGISTATSQSPQNSMFLNGGSVIVQSNVIDTSDPGFTDLTTWIRRGSDAFSEDPDTGENLVVEYLDDTGSWIGLETFPGSGAPGQVFARTYTLPAAGRHSGFRLRFRMTAGSGPPWDYWHIDDVCLVQIPFPALLVTKSVQTISDPINGTSNPMAIPGAIFLYTVTVSNQGPGQVDTDSLAVMDAVPENTSLYVDDTAGDPILFINGATPSGLAYDYATSVTFSSQPGGGPPFNHTPDPDADGFDPAITGYRVQPTGTMNGSSGGNDPSFSIRFRTRLE